jgi:hypothetical protein
MNASSSFRHTLAARILTLIAGALPAAAGCTIGGSSCPDHIDPVTGELCFTPEAADAGADAGPATDPPVCPPREEAAAPLESATFQAVSEVLSGPTVKNGQCCYQAVSTPFCEGRPYLVEGAARTSAAVYGSEAARAFGVEVPPPRVGLDPALRADLAARWTRDALFEHASVASFGRFALELMATGAPADLVAAAHHAALDEVRHAELCFALASGYAGEGISPGPFPFEGQVPVIADLASLAARTAREGCIGETISAAVAAEQLAGAVDPAVRAALAIVVEDEARHAELAWRAVAWAIRAGGARVARAVGEVFAEMGAMELPGPEEEDLREHGRLGSEAMRATAERAVEEIVRPAARALLAAAGRAERSTVATA